MTLKHAISITAALAGAWFITAISTACGQAIHGESIDAPAPAVSVSPATNNAAAAGGAVQKADFEMLASFPFDVPDTAVTNRADLDKVAQLIPEGVKKLDGKLVRIRGFMLPLRESAGKATEFLISRNPPACCYSGATGIHEFVTVKASDKGVVENMDDPVTIEGILRVGLVTDSGFIVGLYKMDGGKMIEQGH